LGSVEIIENLAARGVPQVHFVSGTPQLQLQ
jgi:hypothetical protein